MDSQALPDCPLYDQTNYQADWPHGLEEADFPLPRRFHPHEVELDSIMAPIYVYLLALVASLGA